MSGAKSENEVQQKLETRTTCELEGVDDTWEVDKLDYADEMREAIQTVQEDHDEEVIVDSDSIWVHRVYWNEKTDSVWAGTYGYNRGMEIQDVE